MERFLRSIERSKAERSSKETEENVDNRIQYVGQIASEGKRSAAEAAEKTEVKKQTE